MTNDIITVSRERTMPDGKKKRIDMHISEWSCELANQGPEVFIKDALDLMKRDLDAAEKEPSPAPIMARCGNCFNWMKSNLCPYEYNNKGQHTGPVCDGRPCDKYQTDGKGPHSCAYSADEEG